MSEQQTALGGVVRLQEERYEVTLPSGAKAQILKHCKGKHLMMAGRFDPLAQPGTIQWGRCMVAVRAHVNGAPLALEDIDDLWGDDFYVLMDHCLGKGGRPDLASATLPSSESTEASVTQS